MLTYFEFEKAAHGFITKSLDAGIQWQWKQGKVLLTIKIAKIKK